MYDLKFVRDNEARLREAIAKKGDSVDLEPILELDKRRRALRHPQSMPLYERPCDDGRYARQRSLVRTP